MPNRYNRKKLIILPYQNQLQESKANFKKADQERNTV